MKQFTLQVRVGRGARKGLLLVGHDGSNVLRETIEMRFGPVPRKNYRVTFTLRTNGKYHQGNDHTICVWPWTFYGQRYSRRVW